MSNELSLEDIKELLSKLPTHTNHRIVVNRASYDNYKEVFKLTDDQMDKMFQVSEYVG